MKSVRRATLTSGSPASRMVSAPPSSRSTSATMPTTFAPTARSASTALRLAGLPHTRAFLGAPRRARTRP
jgi:hypothetical protein